VDNRLDSGSRLGGSLKVRELIADHPAELAYDFRSRFGISYLAIGHEVTYLEAAYLISVLVRIPDSWLSAKIQKWTHPVSHEFIVAAHTWDLLATVNSKKKPKPYPMPWKPAGQVSIGNKNQTRADVINKLNAMNNRKAKPNGF
jgi:hypothetical protein